MENKQKGRFRPANGKRIVVKHEFNGTCTVPEAMRPMVLAELERIRSEAVKRQEQGDSVDTTD